jgi:hypothetical protein
MGTFAGETVAVKKLRTIDGDDVTYKVPDFAKRFCPSY